MSTTLLMAAAECASKCCPTHAIYALAGAFVVGLVIGIFIGRKTKKGKCGCKENSRSDFNKRDRAAIIPRSDTPTRTPIAPGAVEIYVGNLSYELTEDELRALFTPYGAIDSVRIVANKFNSKSKGFGFVVMPNREEAEKAIAELNEKEHMGRHLRVNEAKNTLR